MDTVPPEPSPASGDSGDLADGHGEPPAGHADRTIKTMKIIVAITGLITAITPIVIHIIG